MLRVVLLVFKIISVAIYNLEPEHARMVPDADVKQGLGVCQILNERLPGKRL